MRWLAVAIRRMVMPYDCARCGYGRGFHESGGAKLSYMTIDQSGHEFEEPDVGLVKRRMRDNWREQRESGAGREAGQRNPQWRG